jgi:putative transposase
MIKQNELYFNVRMMCTLLKVSASGYYEWVHRSPSKRAEENAELAEQIKAIFEAEKHRAGSIRITEKIRQTGKKVGKNRVARIMRNKGWRAKGSRKFKATTNSNHNLPVAPNLLEQNFQADYPNQKWVSDITYIWTEEGWLYLAVVLELYSRKVIGWAMEDRMTTSLVCAALEMALWRRKRPKDVIVHSDRGSQYCSRNYRALLADNHLICSMSKRGDCFDNAAMESWNGSLKVEAIHGERFKTRKEAKQHIFDYIEVYYNRQRLHSKLGYLSPVDFEEKKVA